MHKFFIKIFNIFFREISGHLGKEAQFVPGHKAQNPKSGTDFLSISVLALLKRIFQLWISREKFSFYHRSLRVIIYKNLKESPRVQKVWDFSIRPHCFAAGLFYLRFIPEVEGQNWSWNLFDGPSFILRQKRLKNRLIFSYTYSKDQRLTTKRRVHFVQNLHNFY